MFLGINWTGDVVLEVTQWGMIVLFLVLEFLSSARKDKHWILLKQHHEYLVELGEMSNSQNLTLQTLIERQGYDDPVN